MVEDLNEHIDDILDFLNKNTDKKIQKNQIEEEIKKFMDYGVPIDQAKQTIIKKYGSETDISSFQGSNERRLISDIDSNMKSVKLKGHVIAINPKEVTVKGEKKQIHYGILGDESGTIQFTSWKDIDVKQGDVIEISNAYTREWRGEPQLNFGDRISIKKADKDSLPESAFKPKECKVDELKSGIGKVEVTAKIVELNEKEIEVENEKKKIFSGILADETGKSQFTSWHDFNLKKDDVLNIKGGYVKSWRGLPQLTFDQNAEVKKLKKDKITEKNINTKHLPLFSLVEKGGALDVEVEGKIIDIQSGSGFIKRCPECNRVLRDNECNIHGNVEGIPDLRLKLVVDDGTGAVNTILNRKISEEILGKTLDECKNIDEEELNDEIHKKLFAKQIKMKGNGLSDTYGTRFLPEKIEFIDIDLEDEAEKILDSLEEINL